MLQYIGKRFLSTLPLMFMIMVVGFFLMELPPGDYATHYVSEMAAMGTMSGGETAQQIRQMYALDRPVHERFFKWAWNFLQGDFGQSFGHNMPVRTLIGDRLLLTVFLSGMSLIISWVIGIPIGVYSATHQYKPGDHMFTLIAFLGVGIPDFMLALVLLVVGTNLLGYVPVGLFSPEFEDAPWTLARLADLMKHIWIPAAITAVTQTAGYMRVMRGNLLDVLRLDYIQTARAKGLREWVIIWKHAVRNAIHPLVMNLGMSFPQIVSSSAIVGMVLNLPIMGPMYLKAVRQQDVYLAGSFLVLVTLLLVVGNLVADVLLAWVDPRIRYD
ncbi:MAG: ABC transporter permease [Actinobacteria bacterium]|nr:ABC transporter permease [Actinomycetota bacterium]